jgi:pyruvate/2-oxoglutarate dehydrogenase complex dihydrolipoamide acyltransferase (E2) component
MATQVILPQLGESVFEGTVDSWLVAEDQPVKADEPLLTITTDKVDTDLPAPASGILLKIVVPAGQTVATGTVLAIIGDADEALPEVSPSASVGALKAKTSMLSELGRSDTRSDDVAVSPVARHLAEAHAIDLQKIRGTGPGGRIDKRDVDFYLTRQQESITTAEPVVLAVPSRDSLLAGFISPVVARLAAEHEIDLDQIQGTGRAGRVTKKDILAYVRRGQGAEAGESSAQRVVDDGEFSDPEILPLSVKRLAIAEHMVLSKRTSPHVTTVMEADMTRVVAARERLRDSFERQSVRLTFMPFFIRAVVAGLRAVPEANSSYRDGSLWMHRRFHIGIATAVLGGLIVPVIRDAQAEDILSLSRKVNDLAERARAKRLSPDEVQGGTFTITNHGAAGSLLATPIINQPQTGILGLGMIQKRAVVVSQRHSLLPDAEDAIAIRPMVYLSFTFDHRVLDGAGADGFLLKVKQSLEDEG